MTRKDLKEHFDIIGENKNISLYQNQRYCGSIELRNGKAYLNGQGHATVFGLQVALDAWAKSLPYPVESYNPFFYEEYRTEMRITSYLEDKMGFRQEYGGYRGPLYIREIGPNCRIEFGVRMNEKNTGVDITSDFGSVHYYHTAKTAEDGIAVLSSIVNSEVLMMSKDMVDILGKCKPEIGEEVETYINSDRTFLGIERVDFKSLMIERLESALKSLKGE